MKIEFVDRYSATGTPYPNPWTICSGPCEGMGVFPSDNPGEWPAGTRPPGEPEEDGTPDDGYRFISCERCNGTGRRRHGYVSDILDVLHSYYYPFSLAVFRVLRRFEDESWWEACQSVPRLFMLIWREQEHQRVLLKLNRERS